MKEKNEQAVKQGKRNRAAGATFEKFVRKELENKGWIVDKWSNNIDFIEVGVKDEPDLKPTRIGKLVPAKHKFRGLGIPMSIGTGFPDFVCFRPVACSTCYARMGDISTENQRVVGVEVKIGKYLTQEEKKKCRWYLENRIFSKIYIAYKTKEKNRVKINYLDFEEYDK